jgi:CBS domain-containing protein
VDTLTVRALMSSPVISVAPHTPLPQLKHLLRERNIRRLPVVSGQRLVGIITLGDVRNAFPSDAPTLSIYELSYLLSSVTAAEIMRSDVITIAADASLVEAAERMLTAKVSGLPVLDGEQLVGMLTESDIFRAVIAGQLPLTSARGATAQARTSTRLIV